MTKIPKSQTSATATFKCGYAFLTSVTSRVSLSKDKLGVTSGENLMGTKDSPSGELYSKSTHLVLPPCGPVMPLFETTPLVDPTRLNSKLIFFREVGIATTSTTTERAPVFVFGEPFFNPKSIVCKKTTYNFRCTF